MIRCRPRRCTAPPRARPSPRAVAPPPLAAAVDVLGVAVADEVVALLVSVGPEWAGWPLPTTPAIASPIARPTSEIRLRRSTSAPACSARRRSRCRARGCAGGPRAAPWWRLRPRTRRRSAGRRRARHGSAHLLAALQPLPRRGHPAVAEPQPQWVALLDQLLGPGRGGDPLQRRLAPPRHRASRGPAAPASGRSPRSGGTGPAPTTAARRLSGPRFPPSCRTGSLP